MFDFHSRDTRLAQRLLAAAVWSAAALQLAGCGGGGGGSSPAASAPVPPNAPVVSVATTGTLYQGQSIALSATATDPGGLALSYSWDFGDSTAVGAGSSVSHTYANTGTYTVTVTASNTAGLTSKGTASVAVVSAAPTGVSVSPSVNPGYVNRTVTFTASATDPRGQALTYDWNYGDATTGNSTSAVANHAYAAAGTYSVLVTATNTSGYKGTATVSLPVLATPASNALAVDCFGANCGASSATAYSGSGVGAWRYTNTTANNASVNLAISLPAGGPARTATLVFTNGGTSTLSATPGTGTLGLPAGIVPATLPASAGAAPTDPHSPEAAHNWLLEQNQQLAQQLAFLPTFTRPVNAAAAPKAQAYAAPPSSRSWIDSYGGAATPYATNNQGSCVLPSGRNLVFWLDPNALTSGSAKASDVTTMMAASCGSSGGFARLNAIMGDFWGPHSYSTQLIADAPGALQDVNVVIADVPSSTGWGGYFYGCNNFKKGASSNCANTNEALVFFINASQLKVNLNYITSALFHEATHMANFYQRNVTLGTSHDTWLEETSAMMMEDIVTPVTVGTNVMAPTRVRGYLASGAGSSYTVWTTLSSASYSIGGSFGAYLHRLYGLDIFKQLTTTCNSTTYSSSYACLDAIIKAKGGWGFADDYARFGAAVFSLLPAATAPSGYGWPSKATDMGYTFPAVDASAYASSLAAAPSSLSSGYTATTQTYRIDSIAAGTAQYKRSGVVVPAGSTLIVTIR